MKLIKLDVFEFCSYDHLSIDFSNFGLTLLYGKTGAGKSTIMDAVCWCLYGVTAKGTSVEGIRPIKGSQEPTLGIIEIKTSSGLITINRLRGKGRNDLYWLEDTNATEHRGKDLSETQELISKRLGINVDTYIMAAYFHEFSPVISFFTAKAKERRALFEQITPLELPNRLAKKMSDLLKEANANLVKKEMEKDRAIGKEESLQEMHASIVRNISNWEKEKAKSLNELENAHKNFEKIKISKTKEAEELADTFQMAWEAEVMTLSDMAKDLNNKIAQLPQAKICQTCGQELIAGERLRSELAQVMKTLKWESEKKNPYEQQTTQLEKQENHYGPQIKKEKARLNPFYAEQEEIIGTIEKHKEKMKEISTELKVLFSLKTSYSTLYDLSTQLRGKLLNKAVDNIQNKTNEYLENYFDSEFRVNFIVGETDNLEVDIQKVGYPCEYKQLSKGQRQLLKLCFSLAVQEAVSNNSGIHVDNLFFDEALDGLSADLKVKAYRVFEKLSTTHSSVFVIDHSEELQSMFSNKIHVVAQEDTSTFE